MVLEARYVGTSSNNLLRSINLNEIDVINNGFLADFRRAQANLALTGTTAFCDPASVAGCQALTLSGAVQLERGIGRWNGLDCSYIQHATEKRNRR